MRRNLLTKTVTVLAGLAAAASLSACSFEFSVGPGSDDSDSQETRDRTGSDDTADQAADRADDTVSTEPASEADSLEESDNGAGAGSGADSSDRGEPSSSSGSGSGAGSGDTLTIAGSELARSVEEAAERESGISGITATCRDLKAYSVGSTTTCDMTMPDGKKYFPLAKVTSIEGSYVEYKLEFPGVHF